MERGIMSFICYLNQMSSQIRTTTKVTSKPLETDKYDNNVIRIYYMALL